MKYLLPLFMVLLLLGSCTKKKTESNRYLRERDMIDILVDVHLAESAILSEQNNGLRSDSLSVELYAKLFDKHGVSRDRFERSMKHYMEDPARMEEIYGEVYTKLSSMQAEFKAKNNITDVPYE